MIRTFATIIIFSCVALLYACNITRQVKKGSVKKDITIDSVHVSKTTNKDEQKKTEALHSSFIVDTGKEYEVNYFPSDKADTTFIYIKNDSLVTNRNVKSISIIQHRQSKKESDSATSHTITKDNTTLDSSHVASVDKSVEKNKTVEVKKHTNIFGIIIIVFVIVGCWYLYNKYLKK